MTLEYVYFAEDLDQRFVKIGYTVNPWSRLNYHNASFEARQLGIRRLRYAVIVSGSRSYEAKLLKRFKHLRVLGREWMSRFG